MSPSRRQCSGQGRGAYASLREAAEQRGQVESAIDAALLLGQVAVAVLGKFELVVSAGDGGLGVGDEGIDPTERLQLAGLMLDDDDRDLGAGDVEAGEAIRRPGPR